jgi:hypothetical protein
MTIIKTLPNIADGPSVTALRQPTLPGSLEPLLAGARARGMADAFDLLGMAAVFVDEDGLALHVSARVDRLVGRELTISPQGRLRAVDLASDAALQATIDRALAGRGDEKAPIVLASGEGRPALSLRVVTVNAGNESAQLLRAVVLIECGDGSPNAALC